MNNIFRTVAFLAVENFERAVQEKLAWAEAMGHASGRRLTGRVGAVGPRRLPPVQASERNRAVAVMGGSGEAAEDRDSAGAGTYSARSCERGIHDALTGVYRNITPTVEEVGLGAAYLDLTGSQILHKGSAFQTATALVRQVQWELGLSPAGGLARNKVLARLAARHAAPGSVFELTPEEEAAFLDTEPIENLQGLPFRHAALLRDYGVPRIGDFGRLPESAVTALLGSAAGRLSAWARGEDNRPVRKTDQTLGGQSAGVTFPRATLDYAIILEAAQRLTDGLLFELRKQSRLIRTVSVWTVHSDQRERRAHRRFQRPTSVYPEIHRAVTNLLSRVLARRVRVQRIEVGLGGLEPDAGQRTLFSERRDRLADLCRSVDRVWAKHGRVILFGDAPSLRKGYNR